MERQYWLDKWASNQIGFHQEAVNPALAAKIGRIAPRGDERVFLPLCGKTRDIGWLLSRGHRVCGAELSERAVAQLFEDLAVEPARAPVGPLVRWSAPGLDIFTGDIMALDRQTLGPVDAVYDRAALVALPDGMRGRYAAHLMRITARAPQLLVCYVYDQADMRGPPFSVDEAQVRDFYGRDYALTLLSREAMPGGLKTMDAATQDVWLLQGETRE